MNTRAATLDPQSTYDELGVWRLATVASIGKTIGMARAGAKNDLRLLHTIDRLEADLEAFLSGNEMGSTFALMDLSRRAAALRHG